MCIKRKKNAIIGMLATQIIHVISFFLPSFGHCIGHHGLSSTQLTRKKQLKFRRSACKGPSPSLSNDSAERKLPFQLLVFLRSQFINH